MGHNYYRISLRYSEYKSRLVVLPQEGILGMGIILNSILSIYKKMEMPMIDLSGSRLSIQIKKILLLSQIHTVWLRMQRNKNGNRKFCTHFPRLADSKSILQKGNTVVMITPAWETHPWYSDLLKILFSQSRHFEESKRRKPSHDNKQMLVLVASGLEDCMKTLVKSSISEWATHHIINCKKQPPDVFYKKCCF